MKLRIVSVTVVLVAAAAGSFLLLDEFRDRTPSVADLPLEVQKKMLRKAASLGSKDNPKERIEYEWRRLRDPRTNRIPDNIRDMEIQFARRIPTKEAYLMERLAKGDAMAKRQVFTWASRGPRNVGGRTRGLGIDVTNANIILAGGVSGGMWRSTDDGTTWVKTTTPSQLHSVTTLAQDTRAGKTNIWYFGTGEYLGNSANGGGPASFRGDGIYKSTDNGQSWGILSSTYTGIPQTFYSLFDYVWRVAVDPSNAAQDEVYAATYGAIWRSTNGGTNWTAVRGGSSPYSSRTDVAVKSTGVVYAAMSSESSQKGIWRSLDGTTWTNITPGSFPASYSRIVMAIAPSNENVVYFLLQQSDTTTNSNQVRGHQFWKYTYVSGDGSGSGGSWVNRGGNLPLESGLDGNARFDSQGGYDLVLSVKPNDQNFVVVGAVNLYRSTDAFATSSNWKRIGGYANPTTFAQYANHHCDLHALAFRPGSSVVLYSGDDGGVQKTQDVTASTVSWVSLNNGYHTTQFYTIAIDSGTPLDPVIIGGTQDNGTWWTNSTNPATSWIDEFSGDGAFCAISNGKSYYYVSSQNGKVYRVSLDMSGNWMSWANIQPTGGSGYLFINPFILDANDDKMMYLAAGTSVWRNSNLTQIPSSQTQTTNVNWTQMTNSAVTGEDVTALAVSTTPPNVLYIGKDDGAVYRVGGANTGNPIPTVTDTAALPTGYVSCIAVNRTDANRILVVYSNYSIPSLFYSTNSGANWTNVSGNLEQFADGTGNGPSCRWAVIVPNTETTTYFVGTSTGLYSTTTLSGASTSWTQEGASTIGNVVIEMIAARPSDGLVAVATHANGIYMASVASTPAAPTLASPADGATSIPTSSTLSWNSVTGATSYTLHVSTTSDFSTFVVNQSGITSTSFPIAGLQNGTQYFWRVSATNAAGAGPFSSTGSFTTIVAAPAAPTLASPSDGATGVSTSPTLVWNALSDAASYTVQLSTTSAFAFLLVNQSGITATSFTVSGLSTNTQYFWRASATNAGGTSLFSATRSFTTSPPSSVELVDGVIPKEFGLAQNYPNPFNPTTIIEFSVAKETRVRIGVLDATGRKVVNLVDGVKSPGRYTVRWDGRDSRGNLVASGVYFYRFESPLYSTTRKMALVR
jgi:hypothetical protein